MSQILEVCNIPSSPVPKSLISQIAKVPKFPRFLYNIEIAQTSIKIQINIILQCIWMFHTLNFPPTKIQWIQFQYFIHSWMDSLWPAVYNPRTVKIQPSDHRLPSGQAVPRSLRPLETAWPLGSLWSSGCIFTVLGLYTTGLMLSIQLFRKYQYSLRVISGHPSYCIERVTWYWYKPSPVLIPAYSWYRWLVCIVFFSTYPTAN